VREFGFNLKSAVMRISNILIYLSIVLFLAANALHGQTTVTVGTATSTHGTTIAGPINIWYRSMHFQTVYTVAELTAAGLTAGASIKQMGWYVSSAPIHNLPSFTISMGHVASGTDGYVPTSDLTVVYQTGFYAPTAGDYDMLELSTPFVWNGTDDLVIDSCFDRVTSYNGSGTVSIYSGSGNSRYVRSDVMSQCGVSSGNTSSYKPVVRFVIEASPLCEPPVAECAVFTVQLNDNNMAIVTAGDIGSNSTADCGLGSETLSTTIFDCSNLGNNPVVYTITDTNGASDSCSTSVIVEVGSGLPGDWVATDIGNQGAGSDYISEPCMIDSQSGTDFTITTGGYNLIPQNTDNLAFAKVPLCGDGGIQARIDNIEGGYAGLMIRESSAPGSKMLAVYSNMSSLLRRDVRLTTNAPRVTSNVFAHFPNWLRLVRQGNVIRAFYRMGQGNSWILFQQVYLSMPDCVEMGIAVFSTDSFGEATADFENVRYLSIGNQGLSAPNITNGLSEQHVVLKAEVLPNPVRGSFILRLNKSFAAKGQATLFNELGQAVDQQSFSYGETLLSWDSGHLPAGMYFMEIVAENGYREVLKVIRQ
jgi:hypothetical protein